MGLFAFSLLRTLHFTYNFILFVSSLWKPRSSSVLQKCPRIPQHVAVILVARVDLGLEECLVQSVIDAVGWCRSAGVEKLTIYDEHGQVLKHSQEIRGCLVGESSEESSESEIEFPLTPPPSDYSASRPISPQNNLHLDTDSVTIHITEKPAKRRSDLRREVRTKNCVNQSHCNTDKSLTLCLTSRKSSKPVIALVARSLACAHMSKFQKDEIYFKEVPFTLTKDDLDGILEVNTGLSSPDFIVIHPVFPSDYNQTPPELHGYPPWHIRLTEIYHNKYYRPVWLFNRDLAREPLPLDEKTFNQALYEFAAAEMRFGK